MTSTQVPSSAPTFWNVFLSFRGTDTRNGFTGHMYRALDRNGVRTFMDDPELRSGDIISSALLEAIQNSRICIVVLSESYASSSWCLDELVEIIRCFRELRRLVIPVFYKIEPSVVRYQTKSFKTAFEIHEEVHFVGVDKLKKWRLTLSQVADFSGHHVTETRSEVDIIDDDVDAVLNEIKPMTINVAKYPVGIDSCIAEITPLLTNGTQRVHYIGIWGMGGVGKTTLAKAVYNANFDSFEGSCFLANVTDVSGQPNGLQGLQAQLIADVLKVKKSVIDNVDKGIQLIRQRTCSKKVLIVVDDSNDTKQLDYLVVAPFASGSVIILTTRHEDLLATVGVEATNRYRLNELGDAQSRELFNKHAFGDEKPSHTFLELSEEILHHAAGLPLALEIFGSNLRNQPETEWKRFIGQMQDVINPDILKKLMISFDSLVDPNLKEMFLDIACFFVGDSRKDVVRILGSCYRDVDPSIDRLKSRCLITFDDDKLIFVHDLLRDMAGQIARQNSPKDEPENHSRLSLWEDICEVLENNKGTKAINGMVPRYSVCRTFATKTFKRMLRLRFLKIDRVYLKGSFEQIFKELRWLHWSRCPLKYIPCDFCPNKLVILDLPKSEIRWWDLTKDLKNLKNLDLSKSVTICGISSFSRLPSLETLNLRGCTALKDIDETIGSLLNLVSLDLKSCSSLRSLPDSVCNLRALKSLNVGHCYSLEALPEDLGNIESLTDLKADHLNISNLPDSIKRLSKLVELRLDSNKNLEALPDICNMTSLTILRVYECEKLKQLLPYGISQLSNLQLPRNLIELRASFCWSMLKLPDLSNLKRLEILEIADCYSLEEVKGLEELTCIRELYLQTCRSLKRLPNLSSLKCLEVLNANLCSSLIEIEGLEELNSIQVLSLNYCTSMQKLPNLSNLKKLETLSLQECTRLNEIECLKELTSVRIFNLAFCRSLTRLPNLSNLPQLEELDLSYCSSLTEIEGLEKLIFLTILHLSGCKSVKKLPTLSNLKRLRTLYLQDCSSLREIEGLEEITSIRVLHVEGCNSSMLEDIWTKSFFHRYLQFGAEIEIHVATGDRPKWMKCGHTEVLMNVLHNFLGLLLYFSCAGDNIHDCHYSIKNKTTGLTYSSQYRPSSTDNLYVESPIYFLSPGSVMVIVPKDDFLESCGGYNEYTIFEVTAVCWEHKEGVNVQVHPLYNHHK